MISTVAVIAEHAEVRADGKLDVNGVYNCRYATELPARFDVTLALRFDVEPLDYGMHQHIAVHIIDEDSAGERAASRRAAIVDDERRVSTLLSNLFLP